MQVAGNPYNFTSIRVQQKSVERVSLLMTLSNGIKEFAYDIGNESHCYLCAQKAWPLSLLILSRISVTQYERLILSCKHNQPAGISWQTPIQPISIKQRPNLINVLTPRSIQWPANPLDVFVVPGRS